MVRAALLLLTLVWLICFCAVSPGLSQSFVGESGGLVPFCAGAAGGGASAEGLFDDSGCLGSCAAEGRSGVDLAVG